MENKQANEAKQKLMYESYYYKQQIATLKKEIDKITLTMLDLSNAEKTVKSLDNKDSLVPIGGNAFIETKISSNKVIVPIGGGYMLKLDRKRAADELNKRSESTKTVLEKMQMEYEKSSKKVRELEEKIKLNTFKV